MRAVMNFYSMTVQILYCSLQRHGSRTHFPSIPANFPFFSGFCPFQQSFSVHLKTQSIVKSSIPLWSHFLQNKWWTVLAHMSPLFFLPVRNIVSFCVVARFVWHYIVKLLLSVLWKQVETSSKALKDNKKGIMDPGEVVQPLPQPTWWLQPVSGLLLSLAGWT